MPNCSKVHYSLCFDIDVDCRMEGKFVQCSYFNGRRQRKRPDEGPCASNLQVGLAYIGDGTI